MKREPILIRLRRVRFRFLQRQSRSAKQLLVLGSFADYPSSSLAGILIAIVLVKFGRQHRIGCTWVFIRVFKRPKWPLTPLASALNPKSRYGASEIQHLFSHSKSFPQAGLPRYPRGFQTAPLPKIGNGCVHKFDLGIIHPAILDFRYSPQQSLGFTTLRFLQVLH